jgi:hypothetical protein
MSDHQILEFAFAGDHPVLAILREQLSQATLSARDYTGVGYYTNITVSAQACRLPSSRLVIHDVHAEVTGLEHGAGFAVILEEGALSLLEGSATKMPGPPLQPFIGSSTCTMMNREAHHW